VLAWLNGWCAAYLAACARLVAGLPFAQVSTAAGLGFAAAAVLAAFAAWRLPSRARRRMLGGIALAGVAVLGWLLWPRPPPPPPTGLRISFLDVGQGDAALLQVPQGAVLVDEGPPEANVAEQVRRLGVRRIAAVVLTHPQRDHVGGAAAVLAGTRVDMVLDPGIASDSSDERAALATARRRGVPVVRARAGTVYRLGRLRLRVLWPARDAPPGGDPNDSAVVLLASYGELDTLLTADAESNVTGALRLPPAEVLKVAHHGSADDGLPALLARLRPRVAVVSVGEHNDYGHPAPSTLAALAAASDVDVYRTDEDGRVVLESDGERFRFRTER
jgi:competence protein ComEC